MSIETRKKSLLYLTQNRGLFIGHLPSSMKICQPSPTFLLSLDDKLSISYKNEILTTKSCIVPAGVAIEVELSNSFIADFMLDRLDLDFDLLKENMVHFKDDIYSKFLKEEAFITSLKDIYENEYELHEVFERLTRILYELNFTRKKAYIDTRIERVINFLRDTPFDNVPIEELAKIATVSVPRLVQLFKQQVGVPIRKYRQWRRLFETANGVAEGHTVTQAALDAGFNDAPHFCNTFKDMFGLSPKQIFAKETNVILKK